MKRVTILLTTLLLAACSSQQGDLRLTNWTLQQEGATESYEVPVPTTVAGVLHRAGVFGENPLEQLNLFDIDKSCFDSTWVFTTQFMGTAGHHILKMEGIGYSADVLVNGTLIASADTTLGVFSVREWDITPLVKMEKNTLEVRTHKSPWGSLNHGFVDWNPHALDEFMGIIAPVTIIRTGDVEVQDVYVRPELSEDLSEAAIEVRTTLVNRSDKPVEGTLKGQYEGGSFSEKVSLQPGETKVIRQIEAV